MGERDALAGVFAQTDESGHFSFNPYNLQRIVNVNETALPLDDSQGKKGGLKITALSDDHKPSLPKEKARVEKCMGRVMPIVGPQGQFLGPDRVWMLNEDTPGLAMSRSLGDGLAHSIGVSWEPGKYRVSNRSLIQTNLTLVFFLL